MALFDRASLVQIPSGYKKGKLYNIKPFDQPFEFERGSAATRVNEDGLIEQVGVSSTQLWNDGDVGAVGTGSYDDGIITFTASTNNDYILFQDLEGVEQGNYYEISFDTVVNSGSFSLLQGTGSSFVPNYLVNETGSYKRIVQYTHATPYQILFWSSNSGSLGAQFDGTISNISIKKVNLDTPRIDYTNGKALLLEPQRTNLITDSEDFSQWQNGGGTQTIVANSTTSPQGLQNASSIQIDSGYVYKQVSGLSVLSGDKYTWSCYVNSASQKITFGGGSVAGTDVYSSEDSGNGWYRQKLTRTFTTSGSIIQPMFLDSISGTDLFYIWGAQAEQGSYATSYIPTNGQTETRLYDYMNSDLSNVLGTGDATFIFDFDFDTIRESSSYLYRIYSGTDSFGLKVSSITNRNLQLRAISGFTTHITINEAAFETSHKMAVRITGSVVEVFYNGAKITGTMTGLSSYNWSLYKITGNNTFVGKTKQLLVFPEALTDTELQQLTTI